MYTRFYLGFVPNLPVDAATIYERILSYMENILWNFDLVRFAVCRDFKSHNSKLRDKLQNE